MARKTSTKRADGRHQRCLTYVDPVTGESRRKVFYGRTIKEAEQKRADARAKVEAGLPVRDSSRTLGEWVEQWRRTSLAASSLKATTKQTYAYVLNKYVVQRSIGAVGLGALKPSHFDAWFLDLRREGLSEATLNKAFQVLRQSLNFAVRDGLLARNPAALVSQPKVPRREAVCLSDDDAAALLRGLQHTRYFNICQLIALTGLRKGEALALRWSDVDFDGGGLAVRGTLARVDNQLVVTEPKTDKSRRDIALGAGAVAALKSQRAVQAADRLRAGSTWHETGYVFTTEFGSHMDPRNMLRAVTNAATIAGLAGVNVHTLRHTAASGFLRDGFALTEVRDLLGHADIRTTADIYGHSSSERLRLAMERRSDALAKSMQSAAQSAGS